METRVKISEQDSRQVEILFSRFISYCEILGYLGKYGSTETTLFDKKWEEAIKINQELTHIKEIMDKKYHPEGNWTNYSFDFVSNEMVYSK